MKTIYLLIIFPVFFHPIQSISGDLLSKLIDKVVINYDTNSNEILLKWNSEKLKDDSSLNNIIIENKTLTFDFNELDENKIIIRRYEAVVNNDGEIEIKIIKNGQKGLNIYAKRQIILCCTNHTEKHCGNISEMQENVKSKGCSGLTAE